MSKQGVFECFLPRLSPMSLESWLVSFGGNFHVAEESSMSWAPH